MARRLIEILKDALIVLLVLAIVALTLLALPAKTITSTPWLATLLRPVAPLLGLSTSELTDAGELLADELHGAAQPVIISVQNSAGRSSAQYDFSALDTAFEQLGGYLAQALDGADEGREVTQQEVLRALAGQSVAFCYPLEVAPSVVAAWLNSSAPSLPAAQWFVLAVEDTGVALYLTGSQSYRCETALSGATLESVLEAYQPDGSLFAFQDTTGAYARAAALSLISPTGGLTQAVSSNPCEARFVASLASNLGFNPYGDAKYVSPTGTTSFTETTHALSVTAAGHVELQVFEPMERFTSAADTTENRIELARELLTEIASGTLGEARLYLTGLQKDGTQTTCSFAYFLNGVCVSAVEEASVSFDGDRITRAELTLRTIQTTAESASLLPPVQAAAILERDALLTLRYVEQDEGTLSPAWLG